MIITRIFNKVFVSFVLIILITSCKGISTDQCPWQHHKLNGNVKSYCDYYYEPILVSGEWTKGDCSTIVKKQFNENGQNISKQYFDYNNNELLYEQKLTYENGHCVQILDYDIGEVYEGCQTIQHNLMDNELSFENYNAEGAKEQSGQLIFENGRLIKRIVKSYDENKIVNEIVALTKYTEEGAAILTETYNRDQQLIALWRCKYLEFDNENNCIKRIEYSLDSEEKPNWIIMREIIYHQ